MREQLLQFTAVLKLFSMFVLGLQLPAYVVTTSVNDYLYQENLPALTKFTICFWFKGQPDDDNRDNDFLISIATTGNICIMQCSSLRKTCWELTASLTAKQFDSFEKV